MYKNLRIVFTCLSAVCIGLAVPLGTFMGLIGFGICAVGALLFFFLMRYCKLMQEMKEPTPLEEVPKEETQEEKKDE